MTPSKLSLMLVLVLLVSAGCAKRLYEAGARFDFQDQIGTAKLTVVSVTPWGEAEPLLAPDFVLNAAEALKNVGLFVRAEEEAFLTSLRAGLRIGLPTIPAPKSDEKPAQKPIEPPALGEHPLLKDLQAALLASQNAMSASNRYRLALALFQEVQLLNKYIRHVVAQQQGYRPYLISMDVALLPARRAEVDADVLIAFVPGGEVGHPIQVDGKLNVKVVAPPDRSPKVIPIIASDDVELNQHSRQVQNAARLGLAITGIIHGVQGAAELQRLSEDLRRTSGRDVNTLQIVASASPNAIMVRFGASYSVETQYALGQQTRRVHALLLVPEEYVGKRFFALSQTVFRRTDGTVIKSRPYAEVERINAREFNEQLGRDSTNAFDVATVRQLWALYHLQASEEFLKLLGSPLEFPVAWAAMGRLSMRSRWSYSEVRLPDPADFADALFEHERYPAFDDHETLTSRVRGRRLSIEPARWRLSFTTADGQTTVIMPTTVSRVSDDLIELTFPALALGPEPSRRPAAPSLIYRTKSAGDKQVTLSRVDAPRAPTPDPPVRALAEAITSEPDGSGELAVQVTSKNVRRLTLEGGTAVIVEGGQTVPALTISTAPTRLVLSLRHLLPGRSVTIVARDDKDQEVGRTSVAVIDSARQPSK